MLSIFVSRTCIPLKNVWGLCNGMNSNNNYKWHFYEYSSPKIHKALEVIDVHKNEFSFMFVSMKYIQIWCVSAL